MKKQSGITLVALVITIIILLILAGISIASISGNNGLFNKAVDARNKTANAQAEEENTMDDYLKLMDNYSID